MVFFRGRGLDLVARLEGAFQRSGLVHVQTDFLARIPEILHHVKLPVDFQQIPNEEPRSKQGDITKLEQLDLSEIFAGLSLPLYVPFDGLPVSPLSHRRHIVPVAPKFPAPQHPFHGRLSPKDLSRRETLSTTRGTGLPEGDATRFKTMTPTSIAPQSDNASR